MVAALIGNGLNVALDPLLIFGAGSWEGFGFTGAALATVIAFTAQCLFMIWRFLPLMRGTPRRLRRSLLAAVWRIGSPVGLQWLIEVGAWMTFVAALARVGEIDLAAHVLVIRIVSVSFLPGHAMGEAASVLVGNAIGAGRRSAAREAFRSALVLAVGIMIVGGLAFLAVPGWLTAPFSAEPAVLAVAHRLLLVAAAFQVFDAVAIASFGALNGAGDTRFVMVVSIASAWLLKIPLCFGLAIGLGWGALGAWLGLTLEIVVIALIGVWRVRGDRWLDLAFDRAAADFVAAETVEVAAEAAAK
jgi:MATE family multidrug resistance protein